MHPKPHFNDPTHGSNEPSQKGNNTVSRTDIELGCPLSVLAQEMAPIDEGFRTRLTAIYAQWHQSIADVLARGKAEGLIIDEVDPATMAVTIVAIMEGSLSAAKVAQSLEMLYQCGCGLTQLLQLIRTKSGSQ